MNIKMPTIGVKGRYRMVVSRDAEMKDVKHDVEFDNLITDVGMNRIGEIQADTTTAFFNALAGRFVVGGGSSAPQFSDVSLDSPVAFASSNSSIVSRRSSYSLGFSEVVVSHQFGQGEASGNLSEIGIQMSSTSGPLFSRALILDGSGNPTTITVLPTDFLTCYYTLRVMIPQTDFVFNVDVEVDEVSVPTTVTIRPLSTESTGEVNGWGVITRKPSQAGTGANAGFFYSGGLSDPTSTSPLGSSVGAVQTSLAQIPYVGGSHETRVMVPADLSHYNGTLSTFRLTFLMGSWQVNFDPPLQKDNTQTMDMTLGYSWARA